MVLRFLLTRPAFPLWPGGLIFLDYRVEYIGESLSEGVNKMKRLITLLAGFAVVLTLNGCGTREIVKLDYQAIMKVRKFMKTNG